MKDEQHTPLVRRYRNNPILTRDDVPYPVGTVHNAGVVKHDERYIMLFRSHTQNGRSIIGKAESMDGYHFEVDADPFLVPATAGVFADYEAFGVEDLRITPIEGEYLLSYSAYSRHGVRNALARTRDFRTIERVALITQADLRNVVFTCGAIIHNNELVIPYAMSDVYTGLATVAVEDLMACMQPLA